MNVPCFAEGLAQDVIAAELECANRRRWWVVALGLKPSVDGDMYCFLWGEDLQSGVSGFGKTATAAMWDFELSMDREFKKPKEEPNANR